MLAVEWTPAPSIRLQVRRACCAATPGRGRWRRLLPVTVWLPALLLLLAGCSSPAVRQQRLVSKPNMLFSDLAAFTYNSARLLPQLEPGAATSGGAQNAGCTSCR